MRHGRASAPKSGKSRMEIRRDPVTQSWVVVGQREVMETDTCPFERPAIDKRQTILSVPSEGQWQVGGVPHSRPLYRSEGETGPLPEWKKEPLGPVGGPARGVGVPRLT